MSGAQELEGNRIAIVYTPEDLMRIKELSLAMVEAMKAMPVPGNLPDIKGKRRREIQEILEAQIQQVLMGLEQLMHDELTLRQELREKLKN